MQADLNRIDAERAQRSAVADLFKAMGGGWRAEANVQPAPASGVAAATAPSSEQTAAKK